MLAHFERMTVGMQGMDAYTAAYWTGGDHSFADKVAAGWEAIAAAERRDKAFLLAGSVTLKGSEAQVAFATLVANEVAYNNAVVASVDGIIRTGGRVSYSQDGTDPAASGEGDVYFRNKPKRTMEKQQLKTNCLFSTLEYAGSQLKGEGKDMLSMLFESSQKYQVDFSANGVSGNYAQSIVNDYFETESFSGFEKAIDAKHPVVAALITYSSYGAYKYPFVEKSGHVVLVVGYNAHAGIVIYMNPVTGSFERAPSSYFYEGLNFPLIKNK